MADLCAGKRRDSCAAALDAVGWEWNAEAEAELTASACTHGRGVSCVLLGLTPQRYLSDLGLGAAESFLQIGCQQGSLPACVLVDERPSCQSQPLACGALLDVAKNVDFWPFGVRGYVLLRLDNDAGTVNQLGRAACDAGHQVSCRMLVQSQAVRDAKERRKLLQRACPPSGPADGNACDMLADTMKLSGAADDEVRKLWRRACFELDSANGCVNFGGMTLDDPRHRALALKALDKGCLRRHRNACQFLMAHYEKTDPAKAEHYLRLEAIAPLY